MKKISKVILILIIMMFAFFYFKETYGSEHSIINHKVISKTKKKQASTVVANDMTISLNKYMSTINTSVEITIFDNKTGHYYNLNHNSDNKTFITASIVKVSFLMQGLHDRDFDENDNYLATNIIEYLDNDATNDFSATLGEHADLQDLFTDLNMNDTHMGETWGQTSTTSSDQVKLLNELVYDHHYVAENKSNYLLNLMNHVDDSQNWGVTSGVGSDSTVDLKNGWLTLDGVTTVNSIGHVVDNEHDYTLAILTQSDTHDIDEGISVIEELSKIVYQNI